MREAEQADYACNNRPRSWPHGLDCEAFTRVALENAAIHATTPEQREHVTPWLRSNPDLTAANLPAPYPGLEKHRWTLDFPEDYAFFQALLAGLPPLPALPDWETLLRQVEAHPEIAAINASRR